MSELKSIEKQGKRVKEISKKIKEKSFSLEELNELSLLLNNMTEKVAVLKYFLAKNDFDSNTVELPDSNLIQKEEILEKEVIDSKLEIEEEEVKIPSFDISIEEQVEEEKKPEPKEETQPSFSFSLFGSEEETKVEEEVASEIIEEKIEEPQPEQKEEEPSSNLEEAIKSRQETESLNDNYFGVEDNSLANKLKNSPIQNLKSAIGINIKFAFISELFANDADEFNQAVDAIDQMTSADDARNLLNELSNKNHWDLESRSVTQFVEMVERRFM